MILNQTLRVDISSDLVEQWRISDDVVQGTHRMREMAYKYLPRLEGESDNAYDIRIKKAVLKNIYKKTLTKAIGNLLKNGITTDLDTENVDAKGGDLESFVSRVGFNAAKYGIAYVLVDAPRFEGELNLQQMEDMDFSPYFQIINNLKLKDIEYFIHGSSYVLSYFEYQIILPDLEGDIRKSFKLTDEGVIWRIEKMQEGDNREIIDEGIIDVPRIPVVAVYGSEGEYKFINKPPFLDLAYYNILHFQATSDASIAHHVAATPMLFMRDSASPSRDEKGNVVERKVNISPWSVIDTSSVDSEVSWVETNGASLTQHREWLKHIEEDMDELSLNFNLESPDATATANNLHAAENQAGISFIKKELERGVREMHVFANWFMGTADITDFEINAVGIGTLSTEQMQSIDKLHDKGLISDEQYVDIVNRTLPFDIEYEEPEEPEPEEEQEQEDEQQEVINEESNEEDE
ncbi:DUF4055 domain-containing protein [Vibrio harveyi]|uniref:DUF4055 domain-containing protein n=1 Tax=Vibrio harveyi TaxID=669 RepID=UPI0006837514|nr:DUF4055 domain-containing protein [Vibrio harveyi]